MSEHPNIATKCGKCRPMDAYSMDGELTATFSLPVAGSTLMVTFFGFGVLVMIAVLFTDLLETVTSTFSDTSVQLRE